jgi:DNA helicase TIP49 (TBP-interacting protein)
MNIEEVQSTTKKQRIATHTHIKGLGLEACQHSSSFPFSVQGFLKLSFFIVLLLLGQNGAFS